MLARGHDAWSCDLLPTERPGPHHQGDVREILDDGWDMMIAHPVCTRLTNSGVRWLTGEKLPKGVTREQLWADLEEAATFYRLLRDARIPKKAIENPIMHRYARERIVPGRRQVVQPYWFGDPAFKATGLELIGLPDLTPTKMLPRPAKGTPEHKAWSKVHRASPGPNRARERSRTFPGMAAAFAAQWA
jgi:hypothetical protein